MRHISSLVCLFVVLLIHGCRECSSEDPRLESAGGETTSEKAQRNGWIKAADFPPTRPRETTRMQRLDFRLVGSDRPLVVMAGQDVVLPCSMSPAVYAEDFNVEWITFDFSEKANRVHSLRERPNQVSPQITSYRGRTELYHSELLYGNLSLKLSAAQPSDSRSYICLASVRQRQKYAIIQLIVRAKGSKPVIYIDTCDDNGICRLVCQSSGWSPKPAVDWLDGRKRKLTTDAALVKWHPEGFTVSRRLLVESGSSNTYICQVSENDHVEQSEINI